MKLIEIPKENYESPQKPDKLFIVSLVTVIIVNCIAIFGLNSLDLKTKIIISLSTISFVCFIDIIVLYTQYYKYYYQSKYFNLIQSLIGFNLKNISEDIENIRKESSELRDSIDSNNAEIKNLKRKIS